MPLDTEHDEMNYWQSRGFILLTGTMRDTTQTHYYCTLLSVTACWTRIRPSRLFECKCDFYVKNSQTAQWQREQCLHLKQECSPKIQFPPCIPVSSAVAEHESKENMRKLIYWNELVLAQIVSLCSCYSVHSTSIHEEKAKPRNMGNAVQQHSNRHPPHVSKTSYFGFSINVWVGLPHRDTVITNNIWNMLWSTCSSDGNICIPRSTLKRTKSMDRRRSGRFGLLHHNPCLFFRLFIIAISVRSTICCADKFATLCNFLAGGKKFIVLPLRHSQQVKPMHQCMSMRIISGTVSGSPEAEVKPPHTLKHHMANTDHRED